MDRRIDLTAHNDFSFGAVVTPLESDEFDILVNDMYDSVNMSLEDYEKLVKYEKIFGRKRHFTDAMTVFMQSDEEYRNSYRNHCWRCGKERRIPWKITGDLCEECEEKMSRKKTFKDYIFGYQSMLSFGEADERGRDLFALR